MQELTQFGSIRHQGFQKYNRIIYNLFNRTSIDCGYVSGHKISTRMRDTGLVEFLVQDSGIKEFFYGITGNYNWTTEYGIQDSWKRIRDYWYHQIFVRDYGIETPYLTRRRGPEWYFCFWNWHNNNVTSISTIKKGYQRVIAYSYQLMLLTKNDDIIIFVMILICDVMIYANKYFKW